MDQCYAPEADCSIRGSGLDMINVEALTVM